MHGTGWIVILILNNVNVKIYFWFYNVTINFCVYYCCHGLSTRCEEFIEWLPSSIWTPRCQPWDMPPVWCKRFHVTSHRYPCHQRTFWTARPSHQLVGRWEFHIQLGCRWFARLSHCRIGHGLLVCMAGDHGCRGSHPVIRHPGCRWLSWSPSWSDTIAAVAFFTVFTIIGTFNTS